ncbi:UDP-4-amino-4,6-dideoxy-N-acetyl-beta-L-altrosamine N-acetyltransferase [Hydrogenovibrio halophilus]|uniref:UDP-4-amino-4, 6-dideoxy-N-acetyl-beta-L-altrosamine N-acetyltransferase n=1 Tax=Hydrogenovibrio halophilus TaxID=373391 RepID=UPI000369457D|nr:UDP-4-amino-4,6-dideoxy-N-acetyl-beta-L-altrosamine N-acetyltransferase [Hydrogenovibrio halophilus]
MKTVTIDMPKFGQVVLKNYTHLSHEALLAVLKMRNHPDVRKKMFDHDPITESEHFHFINRLSKRTDTEHFLVLYQDKILGAINVTDADEQAQSAYVGMFSNLESTHPMAAFILENALIYYGFDQRQFTALIAEVLEENKNVIALHQRFGFRPAPTDTNGVVRLVLSNVIEKNKGSHG